jgi:superfamily I DNA/RNA helicase
MNTPHTHRWSEKQEAIFRIFDEYMNDHLVIRARAGTGKTTTIVEMIIRYLATHPERVITVCAFNKDIATELQKRFVGFSVIVKTLHAIGLSHVKRYWPDVRISFSSDRQNDLADRVCGPTAPDTIKKLVAKLCTKGREIAPHAFTLGDLTDILYRFECEPDEEWATCKHCGRDRDAHTPASNHLYDGYDATYIETKALAAMELAASEKPVKTGIDGSDMIFLPVRNGWLRKSTDDVVVDEAQDMTTAQLEIAQGIARERVVVVGDDKQAIYGFRGADSDSLDRLKAELHARELPLNITYRCGKSIVREAQRLVPDFEAGENNAEGTVSYLNIKKLVTEAGPGDFILSRVNAPLVSVAMSLLRSGKRTRIAGRDIGSGLLALIRKLKARSVPDLLARISAWETKEIARMEAKFSGKMKSDTFTARIDAIRDQAEMLSTIAEGSPSVNEVLTRIESLFTDDGLGTAGMITCSSVHKAKGLEADRVFLLAETFRSHNQEERNIEYVAITRAKSTLVYVGSYVETVPEAVSTGDATRCECELCNAHGEGACKKSEVA